MSPRRDDAGTLSLAPSPLLVGAIEVLPDPDGTSGGGGGITCGPVETLGILESAGLAVAGAGRDAGATWVWPTSSPWEEGLTTLEPEPFQMRSFRLRRPSSADRAWLLERLRREYGRFGLEVDETEDAASLRGRRGDKPLHVEVGLDM